MVIVNNTLTAVELFCFWFFVINGPGSFLSQLSFVIASVIAVWLIFAGLQNSSRQVRSGIAWAAVGALVFVGLTARWLVHVA